MSEARTITLGEAYVLISAEGERNGLSVDLASLVKREQGDAETCDGCTGCELRPDDPAELWNPPGELAILRDECCGGFHLSGVARRASDGEDVPVEVNVFMSCSACGRVEARVFDISPGPDVLEHQEAQARQRHWGPISYIPDHYTRPEWAFLAIVNIVEGFCNLILAPFLCYMSISLDTTMWFARRSADRHAERKSNDG